MTHNHNTTSGAWGKGLTSHKLHGWGGWVAAPWTWLSRDSVQAPCNIKSTQIYKWGSLYQAFLTETMETGTKNNRVTEVTHVFRAFPKRVGPRILSLQSVDYFRTSEHYWVVYKKKEAWLAKLRWSDVDDRMLIVCKWLLWWECSLFSAMIEMTCHVNNFFDLWQNSLAIMQFLWNRGPWIFVSLYMRIAYDRRRISVVANTRTKSIQNQVKSMDVDK